MHIETPSIPEPTRLDEAEPEAEQDEAKRDRDDLDTIRRISTPATPTEPKPPLAPDDHLKTSAEQAEARFAKRAAEREAIQHRFEQVRKEQAGLSYGVDWSPSVELWRCRHSDSYHIAPSQCARPETGGEWVRVTESFFHGLVWTHEH